MPTLRFALPADAAALQRLAQLDSARPPADPILVASVDGELWAATSLKDGTTISDPFRRSAALVRLLVERARQIGNAEARPAQRKPWSVMKRRISLR